MMLSRLINLPSSTMTLLVHAIPNYLRLIHIHPTIIAPPRRIHILQSCLQGRRPAELLISSCPSKRSLAHLPLVQVGREGHAPAVLVHHLPFQTLVELGLEQEPAVCRCRIRINTREWPLL